MTLSAPLFFGFVCVALALLAISRRTTAGRFLAIAIFTVYLVGVANFVLLPLKFGFGPDEYGPIELGRLIELRPFFLSGADVMPLSQLLLNVLLTIPFGFGLPFVFQVRGRDVLVVGVLLSIGIELAQLAADALYLALPAWSIDINDVLLNSLGVLLGYAAFRLASLFYVTTLGRLPVRRGPWTHFHDTMSNSPDPRMMGPVA